MRELGLQKIICPLAFRLNKALIAQCMMADMAAVYRDLGNHYGQNRVSYRGGCVGHESACITGICKSGEWSNRRRRGGWTYWRSVAWWRSGIAAPSAAAGLLRAGAGLCRGACLPSRSRAVLGWLWLASSPGPGLRLIAELFCVSGLNEIKSGRPRAAVLFSRDHPAPERLRLSIALAQQVLGEIGKHGLGQCGERQRAGEVDGREPEPGGEQSIQNAFAKTLR